MFSNVKIEKIKMLTKVVRRSHVGAVRRMSSAACATASNSSSCSSCPMSSSENGSKDISENPSENEKPAQVGVWHRFSRSIFRGFKFDRIFPSDGLGPAQIVELDRMAMTGLRATDIPPAIIEKIIYLLQKFGRKRDLERYGRYLRKKTRSRTCVEIPRVLASETLHDDGNTRLDKLMRNQSYKDLHQIAEQWRTITETGKVEISQSPIEGVEQHATGSQSIAGTSMSEITRLALAHAEDSRHKLYQMTWSPESTLTYLAHNYAGAYAANFRILYEISVRCPQFKPKSIMDYGAGPAPSTVACFELWRNSIEGNLIIFIQIKIMNHMNNFYLSNIKFIFIFMFVV